MVDDEKNITVGGLGSPLHVPWLTSCLEAKEQLSTAELLHYKNLSVCLTCLVSTPNV